MFPTVRSLLVRSALAAATVSASLHAQPRPGITRSYVQVVTLKPDMVNEWLTLQRNEVIPAQKKAGVASRITLATAVGDLNEYVTITPFPEWAAMDGANPLVRALGAEGAAALIAKLRRCILVQTSYMANRRDSLSVPATDGPIWRYSIQQLASGKQAEYLEHYRRELLPVAQKAKAQGLNQGTTLAIRGAGAPSGEVIVITHHAKFADLDKPPMNTSVLGAAEAAKLNAKTAALATQRRVVIRRVLADLTY